MTGTPQIPILHICSLDDSKSKGIIAGKKISQVCSTDKSRPEIVITNESSMEESESESFHKSINKNKEKYSIDETSDKEPSVIDNPFINEPRYFNLFECGKNFLNNLDATCEQACMTTSEDKYYTEICNDLTDYNDHNNMPLSNANNQESIRKFMVEESITDANNVTVDTFSHASNAQRENKN